MTQKSYQPPEGGDDAVERAIGKLKSYHDGDSGVLEIIACGSHAIGSLRRLLFDREPSGLCESRVRAVDALGRLDAHEVLIEFLSGPREVTDPVERLGEDAVINAAAKALAYRSDQRVFKLLVQLARRPCLTGVMFALGASRRPEAIPYLIEALSEDAGRLTAEIALKRMGAVARPALIKTANQQPSSYRYESESRLRQRRSALKLLVEMGTSRKTWQAVRNLTRDNDAEIATFACEICLANGSPIEKREAVLRLISLLPSAHWILRDEIKRYLVAHLYVAKEAVADSAHLRALLAEDNLIKELVERVLPR
jgi:HEAT repeat protein